MDTNAGLWVQALRSGRYQQTRGRLRAPGRFPWRRKSFCAMGVLYDVYLRQRGDRWPKATTLGRVPADVLDWAGISRGLEERITMENDQGMSFNDVASVIEAHFERLSAAVRSEEEAARVAQQAIERIRRTSRTQREEEIAETN